MDTVADVMAEIDTIQNTITGLRDAHVHINNPETSHTLLEDVFRLLGDYREMLMALPIYK